MIVNLKSQTNLSGLYIIWNGSTNLEKPGNYGISHLLEHLICKSFDYLHEDLDRDGIDWNAYTSSDEIVFYMTGLDDRIKKWKYKFQNIFSEFKITKEQFENEKKIVLQEYGVAFNNQFSSHLLNLTRKIFNKYDSIGLKSDIENLKYEDIINFWNIQFSKPSKIINISKSSEYKDDLIIFSEDKSYKSLEFGNNKVPLELNNKFKDTTNIIILSPIINENFAYIRFINHMLSLGLKSPLYQETREKNGLAYYLYCSLLRMGYQGVNIISTLVSNENYDKIVERVKDVISNPAIYLTKDRFDIVKDYLQVRKEKDEILKYKNVNSFIEPSGWAIYDILDSVTYEKILEIYDKYYKFENFYISNDKTEFVNN